MYLNQYLVSRIRFLHAGHSGLMSDHFFVVPSSTHIFLRSSTVKSSTQYFLYLTTTDKPSFAILNSVYSIPASSSSAFSSSLIGREAFEKSVSPAMNFSNPPPVPDTPTVTLTLLVLLHILQQVLPLLEQLYLIHLLKRLL